MKTGFLIERKKDDRIQYACANDSGFFWSDNSGDAIAFLDRRSADQVAMILENDADGVREHQFGADVSSKPASLYDLWLETAHRQLAEKKEMPIVLGMFLYSYFGHTAQIIDVDVYSPGRGEATLEGPFGETAQVDFEDLRLITKRK